jgi:spore maturation protein CgeB
MFYHSLLSDWNHGNAHFLRGVAVELIRRGHEVRIYEPEDGWSLRNLLAEQGVEALEGFRRAYPDLTSHFYDVRTVDVGEILRDVDLCIVHEWNTHDLVRRIGQHRARHGHYALLFHDTHHRAVSDRAAMAAYDLRHYDGVLAFGAVLRDLYLAEAWTPRAWVWHEAADTTVFHPYPSVSRRDEVCGSATGATRSARRSCASSSSSP